MEASELNPLPESLSGDGRLIAFLSTDPQSGFDLWLRENETGETQPFAVTTAAEVHGQLSADGQWLAYASDETGQFEIYVQPVPSTGAKYQISTGSGLQPIWRGDGTELYFITYRTELMAATIDTSQGFRSGTPERLFRTNTNLVGHRNSYDVTRDGQRFLVNVADQTELPLTVILDWTSLVQDQ